MATIAEIRQKYPQYRDLSDGQLADALHRKFYADMPREQFDAKIGLQPQEQPSTGYDMLRSGMAGVRQGMESVAGSAGDARGLISGLATKMGMSDESQQRFSRGMSASPFPMFGAMAAAPTTEQVRGVTDPAIGKAYEPQTVPGEYARTAGQFLPAAMAGPGGLARKTLMTVIPSAMSETAGQVTKGTAAEPYARAVAGIAGGFGAAGRRATPARQAAKGAPTQADLKAKTDALYGQMRGAGIRYDANEYGNTLIRMAADLRKQGLRRAGPAKEAFEYLDELAKDVGKSPDFDDINNIIQEVGGRARDAAKMPDGGSLAKAMGVIRDHLDDFEESAVMVSNKPMPKDHFNRLRLGAREVAKRNIKGRALQEVMDKADTYAAGQEAGVRNGINNLLRSKRGMQLFKGEERKALLEVSQGRKALRTLSRFGFDLTRLSGNATFVPAAGAAAATGVLGPVAAGGLLAAGTAAKAASPYMTQRAFDTASAAIRSGKINSPQVLKEVKAKQMQALIRGLLASRSAESSANTIAPIR
jgi:hypothetical protein